MDELREITRFCINRMEFEAALKLVEELRRIEESMEKTSPL